MRAVLLLVLALILTPAFAEEPGAAPQWFLDEISTITADGGRWIADNSAYKTEDEPFDAYAVEWKSGFGGTTMSGRLFGLRDGKETASFWEFRQYWHPARKEAVLEQFGWGGAVGVGTVTHDGDGETLSDQTFYSVDGTMTRTGHKSRFSDANTHETDSFNIVDDEWLPRRQYIWKREAASKPPPDKK